MEARFCLHSAFLPYIWSVLFESISEGVANPKLYRTTCMICFYCELWANENLNNMC